MGAEWAPATLDVIPRACVSAVMVDLSSRETMLAQLRLEGSSDAWVQTGRGSSVTATTGNHDCQGAIGQSTASCAPCRSKARC
jgi:hypothetical protein